MVDTDMNISLEVADYKNPKHGQDLIDLLSSYALDPMGGGKALDETVKKSLVATLAGIAGAVSILCYVDDQPAGLINCFEGFSTFKCKPLLNIHDVVVVEPYRGLGLSQRLLEQVELQAIKRGCCKLTMEVLEGNVAARASYVKYGFEGYELDPQTGKALFWEKELQS